MTPVLCFPRLDLIKMTKSENTFFTPAKRKPQEENKPLLISILGRDDLPPSLAMVWEIGALLALIKLLSSMCHIKVAQVK